MRVFRGIPARADTPIALIIGNFDGVHLGHRAMIARLSEAARSRGLPTAVMTFEPQPQEFFAPDQAPARLTSLREKLELLCECGVARVYVGRFDYAFAQLTADDFVTRVLRDGLAVKWLLVGDDLLPDRECAVEAAQGAAVRNFRRRGRGPESGAASRSRQPGRAPDRQGTRPANAGSAPVRLRRTYLRQAHHGAISREAEG